MKVDDQSMNTPSLRIIHMSSWYVFSLIGSLKLPYFCIFSPHLSHIYGYILVMIQPQLKPELFALTYNGHNHAHILYALGLHKYIATGLLVLK